MSQPIDAPGRIPARTIGIITGLGIFIVDQLAKYIVVGPLNLAMVGQIRLLPILNLTWVENRGVSMGFLTADTTLSRWLLVLLTVGISVVVALWLWREDKRPEGLALGLVLGGAFGNILDRMRFGHVVDFIDLHVGGFRPFLVFNPADAAITIGVVLLLLRALTARERPAPTE